MNELSASAVRSSARCGRRHNLTDRHQTSWASVSRRRRRSVARGTVRSSESVALQRRLVANATAHSCASDAQTRRPVIVQFHSHSLKLAIQKLLYSLLERLVISAGAQYSDCGFDFFPILHGGPLASMAELLARPVRCTV